MAMVILVGRQIEIGAGRVLYLEPSFATALETVYLKEDLLQIEFDGCLLLDVGWYGGSEHQGAFRIVVIPNFDWSRPIFEKEVPDLEGAIRTVENVIKEVVEKKSC